jgi:hypothetical protein
VFSYPRGTPAPQNEMSCTLPGQVRVDPNEAAGSKPNTHGDTAWVRALEGPALGDDFRHYASLEMTVGVKAKTSDPNPKP